MLNIDPDFEEYKKLENKNVPLIKNEDLPEEFSQNAYDIIIEFIQKTKCLDYEWVIYFDYYTGEIFRCVKGKDNQVRLDFEDGEFEGKHIVSIHNHPINAFSPPSGKNFNILLRDFEDYEFIVGRDGLWILKAKGLHNDIIEDIREASLVYYILTLSRCADLKGKNGDKIECEDSLYGDMLSNYINDKNIKNIQLIKKEYITMTKNKKTDVIEFEHFESISNMEDLGLIQDFIKNPYLDVNKVKITEFFAKMGVEVNANELADAMKKYSHDFL
ncbi:hypothetical protein J5751_07310 [bacterium]|nr:hypothetical protein [bacterium]